MCIYNIYIYIVFVIVIAIVDPIQYKLELKPNVRSLAIEVLTRRPAAPRRGPCPRGRRPWQLMAAMSGEEPHISL